MSNMRNLVALGVLVVAAGWQYLTSTNNPSNQGNPNSKPTTGLHSPANASTKPVPATDQQAVLARIRASKDDTEAKFWAVLSGKVVKNLKDDNEGDQHQKFLLEVASDITLLVAHNIDLAPRAPVTPGDRVTLRGEYVWNNRGGVLHWTHHDPKGRREGGWIEVNGKRYD